MPRPRTAALKYSSVRGRARNDGHATIEFAVGDFMVEILLGCVSRPYIDRGKEEKGRMKAGKIEGERNVEGVGEC